MRKLAPYIFLALLLTGCDRTIHEYPTSGPPVELTINASADLTPPEVYQEITYTRSEGRSEVTRSTFAPYDYFDNSNHQFRFVIEIYEGNRAQAADEQNSNLIERHTLLSDIDAPAPQCSATTVLPHGQYTIVGWADYTDRLDPAKTYYDCGDLSKIKYHPISVDDNHAKEAFAGVKEYAIDFDYRDTSSKSTTIDLIRPIGYYSIMATDIDQFEASGMQLSDIYVVAKYKLFVSSGYNAITQSPNEYEQTRQYISEPLQITRDGDDLALLGYDFVFVNGTRSVVMLDLYVFNSSDNSLMRSTTDIEIPLVRNKQTIVRGEFLTTSFGSGGVGIDEGFDDEIVIPIY